MPIYYFHIRHADRIAHDPEGSEFPDLQAALHEANESLRELVAHALVSKQSSVPLGIQVFDEDGNLAVEVDIDAVIPQIRG
ncbi:hypothetical protein HJA89_00490 [Rhizobium bangladeshense]|uniref:DUF6894 family protein n=1 Tax=Rhizobium bangladeshense TaxID=1138189 RepID=UPI001C83F246|nr:hypothetical protein [Rhizobium bangladeshense]MBX4871403.1 hypothetical protein [Rhizobium bangladeshense]MBX4882717.1 hypothetical protein [Rhizobium bangladeshense]